MKNLLNIEGNVLTGLSVNKNLTAQEFNTVFQYYDQNSKYERTDLTATQNQRVHDENDKLVDWREVCKMRARSF